MWYLTLRQLLTLIYGPLINFQPMKIVFYFYFILQISFFCKLDMYLYLNKFKL